MTNILQVYVARVGEMSVAKKIVAAFIMAGVTGAAAQIRIPLPFTPVPLTGQVFAVLLSGVILGARFGAMSQVIYLLAGVAGLPMYAGFSFGPAVLFGPTGGYILGFIPAAYLVGSLRSETNFFHRMVYMMLAVAIIYIFGSLQFAIVMKTGLRDTLFMAVVPFIGIDLAKAFVVAAL